MCTINTYYRNRNILNNSDLASPIYKYMPLEYVLTMVSTKKLRFGKVSEWEDVYENFFLKADFRVEGIRGGADTLIPGVFGQSWTLLEESDAMWRIYSSIVKRGIYNCQFRKKVAVRIKTTAEKLFNAVYLKDEDMASVYIGKVEYVDSIDDFVNGIPQPLNFSKINDYLRDSMFIKRKPFEHEQEVRPILIYAHNQPQFGQEQLLFDIAPSTFIDEFMIDPRLRGTDLNYVRERLRSVGIDNGKINQSQLYDFNPPQITL